MGKNLAKVLGTVAVWGGVCGLCWMLNSFSLLSGWGAAGIIFVGAVITEVIWVS